MKKIIYILFLIISSYCFALREVDGILYRKYSNTRFGYSLEYPAEILFMQPPPTNNDGREFLSADHEVRMVISGTYFVDVNHLDSNRFKQIRNDYYSTLDNDYRNANITYKTLNESKGLYVISGIMDNKVFYKRVQLDNSGEYFIVFQIEYPIAEKDMYNKIVETVVKTIEN